MYCRPQRDLHSKTTENECTVRIASNLKFGHVEILSYINRAGYISGHFRLMKQCNKCGEVKALTEYYKQPGSKDGLKTTCKICKKEYYQFHKERFKTQAKKQTKEYHQQWKISRGEQWKEYVRKYEFDNKEKIQKYHQQYDKNYLHPDKDKKRMNQNKWAKIKRSTDPKYKLRCYLSTRLHEILGGGRSRRTLEILGCSPEELIQHLESQFQPWMTWENMGGRSVSTPNTTWDIDHIIPLSSAQTEEDVYRLSHYTNLQPLCSYHNRFIKRDKY